MAITAALIKELRERTGAGMMDCKKALTEAGGDIDKAIEAMRVAGQAKADKKAGRVAAEGLVKVARSADGKQAAMVEVNCETDFVARDEGFINFVTEVANTALANKTGELEALLAAKFDDSMTVEEARHQLIAKIGENINVRRVAFVETENTVSEYVHGTKIGVLVEIEGDDEETAKDIAMHVAATNPEVVAPEDVNSERVEEEKRILTDQALESGKPAEVVEKMVVGRLKKFLSEISLLGQAFVKDPSITVDDLVKSKKVKVVAFNRFEVGEGIEKAEENFVDEVMAQVQGS